MKKRFMSSLAILVLVCFFTATIYGWPEDHITKSFKETGFTGLSVGYGMRLEVKQAKRFEVKVKTTQRMMELIRVKHAGDTLTFSLSPNMSFGNPQIEVFVTLPELTKLTLSGGSHGEIGKIGVPGKNFTASLSGGSTLNGTLQARSLRLDASGGSRARMDGKAELLTIYASGGSTLSLKEFQVETAEIDLSGGSRAEVYVNEMIHANASGGSQVYYLGRPRIGKTSFSGGSGIRSL